MKMRFAPIFLGKLLLCLSFLYVCNGAPPDKDGGPSSPVTWKRYTDQERQFILNGLLSLPKDYMEKSEMTIWEYLATELKELRRLNPQLRGFPQDRTAQSLRQHFSSKLTNNAEFMAALPDPLKKQLCDLSKYKHNAGVRPYTDEENTLLIDELSKISGPDIPRGVWAEISRRFRKKRGSPGFYEVRTPSGLRNHFLKILLKDPNTREKLPEILIQKFGGEGTSNQPASRGLQTDLQATNEEQDEEYREGLPDDEQDYWESVIEELKNAPVEVDFSRLDKETE